MATAKGNFAVFIVSFSPMKIQLKIQLKIQCKDQMARLAGASVKTLSSIRET